MIDIYTFRRRDIVARTKTNNKVSHYIEGGGFKNGMHNQLLDIKKNPVIYILLALILLYFLIFNYAPMVGLVMAFEKFSPAKGLFGSRWVGLDNFKEFFSSPYFGRTIRNTIMIGIIDLAINFPAPIIFALILNEISNKVFKKTVQTISYMPYFISAVVACGLVVTFIEAGGPLSTLVAFFKGGESVNLLNEKKNFWLIYVLMNLWQGLGYGSIIYLSALSSVDKELYEAAMVDGAGKWKQCIHITIPGILPMVLMMLILRMGAVFAVGADKILLLYSPANYEFSDVINTYTYRLGLLDMNYGLSTAVGLFNSIVGTVMLVTTNKITKKLSGSGLF